MDDDPEATHVVVVDSTERKGLLAGDGERFSSPQPLFGEVRGMSLPQLNTPVSHIGTL